MNKPKHTIPIDYSVIADIYDVYVDTDFDVPFFLEIADRYGKHSILELMCGTGRLSLPLIEAGCKMTCLDYNADLLDLFKKKLNARNLQAELVNADVRDFDLKKEFPLIALSFHAFAELITREDHLRSLRCIRNHLEAGGVFVCTMHNPVIRLKGLDGLEKTRKIPMQDESVLEFTSMGTCDPETGNASGMQTYRILSTDGRLLETRRIKTSFHLFTHDEFRELAETTDFKIKACYGDYDFSSFEPSTSPFMLWELMPT